MLKASLLVIYDRLIILLESDLQTKRKYIEILEKECERKEQELKKIKGKYLEDPNSGYKLKVEES